MNETKLELIELCFFRWKKQESVFFIRSRRKETMFTQRLFTAVQVWSWIKCNQVGFLTSDPEIIDLNTTEPLVRLTLNFRSCCIDSLRHSQVRLSWTHTHFTTDSCLQIIWVFDDIKKKKLPELNNEKSKHINKTQEKPHEEMKNKRSS